MKMSDIEKTTVFSPDQQIKINKWKVREGFQVNNNQLILLYELTNSDDKDIKRLKATKCGVVKKRFYNEGDIVDAAKPLLELSDCIHATVIKDMCADCGADLRQDDNNAQSEASVPMVHSVPELKVSHELAQELGKADTVRLLKDRKLVLLVDLDQTLIHTTNDNVPNNLKGVYHFQLNGPNSQWFHTRLRPGTFQFLENVSPYFELHICTFGARNYAHTIAQFLDNDGKYFSHRILSRDECLSVTYKTDNLRALFPCGDSMVCIIDDREDVWNMATNLIQVKPYHFFQHTGDINAPPGMSKHELDGKGVDFGDVKPKLKNTQKPCETSDEQPLTETVAGCSSQMDEPNESTSESAEPTTNEPKTEEAEDSQDVEPTEKSDEVPDEPSEKPEGEESDDAGKENTPEISSKLAINEENSDESLIDIEDPDDYLLYLEPILIKIHSRFYAHYDETNQIPDLKTLLPKIRAEVLLGKTLVFSGLVPQQNQLEKSKAYMIARSLGANVIQQITDEVTHLVASRAGTFKMHTARQKSKIHIVSPEWLWTCAERWECVEEKLYPLDSRKASKTRQPPAHCHSPEHVVIYNNFNETDVPNSEQSTSGLGDTPPKFFDTINPLLSFSNDDIDAMRDEVDEDGILESDSSDDDSIDMENPPLNKDLRKRKREEENEQDEKEETKRIILQAGISGTEHENEDENDDESSSSESEDESPAEKFRRGCDLPSDDDDNSGNSSNNDEGDDGDWNMMGAALEREFLGLE